MARVTWTRAAQEDVRAIRRFIAQDSPAAADAMVRRLRAAGVTLARFPETGRIVPEYGVPEYREVIVNPFRVIYWYRRETDRVQVLMVVHGSRMLPPLPDPS